MQKAETSTIDAKMEVEKPKLTDLVKIAIDNEKKIYVNWPVDKKELCIIAMAEAIKLVTSYEKPIIEKPRFMDFVRGIKR
jgi:hypothetical protein